MDQTCLSPEYQSILDKFIKFRIQYCDTKKSSKTKEELIRLQKMELDATIKRFDQLVTAFTEYQIKNTATINRLEGELHQANKAKLQLEERCHANEAANNEYLMGVNQAHLEEVKRLEEDLEIVKSNQAYQEEQMTKKIQQANMNMEHTKRIYEEQIADKDKKIEELQARVEHLTQQLTKKGTQFSHPALHDNSKIPSTKGKKKTPAATSAFKNWPDLEVQKTGGKKNDTLEKAQKRAPDDDTIAKRKKKKLFTNVDAGSYDVE
ncbi:hypothetical protein HCN44_008804 [Aphidius gifuensis]|uniref:Uncharacterized protein n=1 Tax=Aphidius gifuensis TaxID=684658 RepID=A0A834XTT8_APHGI|nr:myosin heavy chain, non-muscle-like [Aphidius gifuensis]KAF7991492.1 hypothetical protein HCN44_008804 [Aphidius gifuensis]